MGYRELAAAVIMQAADDMGACIRKMDRISRKLTHLKQNISDDAGTLLAIELLQGDLNTVKSEYQAIEKFITGQWCEGLCALAGVDHGALKHGIKKLMAEKERKVEYKQVK